MSCGENIQVSYYSAILAKALKEEDVDQFIELYDVICGKATEEEVETAKEKARNLSNEPLEYILSEIKRLEKCGAEPLYCVFSIGDNSLKSDQIHNHGQNKNDSVLPEKHNQISIFHDMEETVSSEQTKPFFNENGKVNNETLVFDSLKDGERSLVDVQNRLSDTSKYTSSKVEDYSGNTTKLPVPTAGKTLTSFEGRDGVNSTQRQPQTCRSTTTIKKTNSTQSKQSDKKRTEKTDGDVSACINFNLFKPIPETHTKKKTHTNLNRKNTDSRSDGQKLLNPSSNSANAVTSAKAKKSKSSMHPISSNTVKEFPEMPRKIPPLASATNYQKLSVLESNCSELQADETSRKQTTKPKRRTIKEYQRERLNQTGNNIESNKVQTDVNPLSKARQRRQNEQRKLELLPDETVNQILIECGDLPNVESEKINNKDSHKKEKRKRKKLKKAGKKIEEQAKDPKGNHHNEMHPLAGGDAAGIAEWGKEIMAKNKQKDSEKLLLRGQSRQNSATMKSRNCGSSDHVTSGISEQNKLIEGGDSLSLVDVNPKTEQTLVHGESNQRNSSQWSSIVTPPSSLFDVENPDNQISRYPGRFKTTLDSTGCSLASSSEDGSSTSSSSNTNSSSVSELLSPDAISHVATISSMSTALIKTAAKDVKKAKNVVPKNTNQNKITPPRQKRVPSIPPKKRDTSNDFVPANRIGKTCKKPKNTSPERTVAGTKDNIEENVISELNNEWGLNFFYAEGASQVNAMHTPTSSSTKSYDAQVSFEVGNSDLEVSIQNTKKKLNQRDMKREVSSRTRVVTSIAKPTTREQDCGNFDVKEAAQVLMQEWQMALRRGKIYKEEG